MTTVANADVVSPSDEALTRQERDYLFDVNGYRVLRGALSGDQLQAINAWVDAQDPSALRPGEWIGDVEVHTYGAEDGVNFQNIIEGGPVFEELIDHPSWIDEVRRYIISGAHQHLRIDECFLNVRRSGGYIPIHSGGDNVRFTGLFRWHNGNWAVGQINVLMALTDIGYGDGATTIVPGSHKAHSVHPHSNWSAGHSADQAIGMREVHLRAGDAVMFTDGICHGSMPRTNPGERRVLIYRYAPHLLAPRMNYLPSEELMARLSPARRAIVMPTAPRMRPGRTLAAEAFPHNAVGG
ncbi:phytanoyl-CoA dioxygenase family protein [Actinopolymorpha singaporensis]